MIALSIIANASWLRARLEAILERRPYSGIAPVRLAEDPAFFF